MNSVLELGGALRQRRAELGLTQAQVAERAGVARSWLSKMEDGKHPRAEVQKVLDVVGALGFGVELVPQHNALPADDPFSMMFEG